MNTSNEEKFYCWHFDATGECACKEQCLQCNAVRVPIVLDKEVELVQELIDLRNKLYDELPSGEIKAWDLIQVIKWHVNDLDNYTTKLSAALQPKKDISDKELGEEAIEFAEWILNNRYNWDWKKRRYVAAWNNYSEHTTKDLYNIFKTKNSKQ